jgi:hypothetical protein
MRGEVSCRRAYYSRIEGESSICVFGLLFVRQIKVPRGGFICVTNKKIQVHK